MNGYSHTSLNNASPYRYAFNGMEKDDEVKGQGNSYTTEFRMLDPRIGRWLSLDPEMKKFPSKSPYITFSNNPIIFVDPHGDADYYNSKGQYMGKDDKDDGLIVVVTNNKLNKKVKEAIKTNQFNDLPKFENGVETEGGIALDVNVFKGAYEVLEKSLSEGMDKEFGTSFSKNSQDCFEMCKEGIVEGEKRPVDGPLLAPLDLQSCGLYIH